MVRIRVKEIAEAKGFTISSLSRRSDISVPTIRKLWRHPETVTTTDTLEKLARVLDVPLSELLELEDYSGEDKG